MAKDQVFHARGDAAGLTLLRAVNGWTGSRDARVLITGNHVQVNGNLCIEPERILKASDVVHVFEFPRTGVPTANDVVIRYSDADVMVVEKPAGMTTLRHEEERGWDDRRRQKQATLEEVLQAMVPTVVKAPERRVGHPLFGKRGGKPQKASAGKVNPPLVRPVHRLDRDTSGLMLFALSTRSENALTEAFKGHSIERAYMAVVHGKLEGTRTIESWMVRDRGDGLRGSDPRGADAPEAQRAVTHVEAVEALGEYTLVRCRLETGRTHQIRIHMAENGHMLCGERVYVRPAKGKPAVNDQSGSPRHALHSAELAFMHPVTAERKTFTSLCPADLALWLKALRRAP